jgi:DNA-binding MarR family transcriptional regulator
MGKDFLIEMGYPGLTARLKRLNDQFVYQTKEFYKTKGLDIEPNWHMIFLLLIENEKMTVMEIAQRLNLSHPGIVKLIDKMKKKGYINSTRDLEDHRKFQLKLSKKAIKALPELQEYWKAGNKVIEEMLNCNNELLNQLEIVEKNMEELDFNKRMREQYKKLKSEN